MEKYIILFQIYCIPNTLIHVLLKAIRYLKIKEFYFRLKLSFIKSKRLIQFVICVCFLYYIWLFLSFILSPSWWWLLTVLVCGKKSIHLYMHNQHKSWKMCINSFLLMPTHYFELFLAIFSALFLFPVFPVQYGQTLLAAKRKKSLESIKTTTKKKNIPTIRVTSLDTYGKFRAILSILS